MKVVKFGGSLVTANNLKCIKNHVDSDVGVVVVSAVGRSCQADSKVTDLLDRYFVCKDEATWAKIVDKFRLLVEVNCIDIDVDKLLFDAKVQIARRDKHFCLSVGEELTAKCVACLLGRQYVDAAQFVKFDGTDLDFVQTEKAVRLLEKSQVVVGGFYGANSDGKRMTFSRGGGDVSGAIFAVYSSANKYVNLTDVDGVCVADPQKVGVCQTLPNIGYGQMRLLAKCGAKVLHPDSTLLPQKYSVPIVVANGLKRNSLSTVVSDSNCTQPVVCVVDEMVCNSWQTSVLHNLPQTVVNKAVRRIDDSFGANVLFVKAKDNLLQVYSVTPLICEMYNLFVTHQSALLD